VLARESGMPVASLTTRDEALDAARALLGAIERSPYLRDPETRALVGVWRWMDATAVEDEVDGAPRIDERAIESMAAMLNASSMARPIDGGPGSVVHGTAHDSGTPANGWAHAGVPVIHADGRMHLYLWGELLPQVAREFDSGRIAHGSVHVRGEDIDETGAIVGAELASHALTNDPMVQTLVPSTALMSARGSAVVLLNARGNMGTKKSITKSEDSKPEDEKAEGEMTLEQALAKIAELAAQIAEMSAAKAEGEGDDELEAAKSKAASLEAKVAFLEAQLSAVAEQVETPEEKATKAVEAAIAKGQIAASTKAQALVFARADLAGFETFASKQRAVPVAKQAKGGERTSKSAPGALDPKNLTVIAMRGAGMSDTAIKARLGAAAEG
jgi:hypothetical protein